MKKITIKPSGIGDKKNKIKKTSPVIKKKSSLVKKERKKESAKPSLPIFYKYLENPIISPREDNGWEAWQVFNPGAILLKDKIHFIYRAIGEDGLSRLGYASSDDGFIISERLPYPIYKHHTLKTKFSYYSFASGGSFGGCEDPRLACIDKEDELFMTYTACDEGLRVALTSIKIKDFLQKKWQWKPPVLISPPGEVHKNWVLFPEKINGKYAILHSINPQVSIAYRDSLEFQKDEYIQSYYNGKNKDKNGWEKWIRGVGAPPIKTNKGWLLFYHAMDDDLSKYKLGAMLLDLKDPTKILHRSLEPVLEPDKDYENNGFKTGVVYASGATIKDDKLLVYYGASDSYVGVAYASLEDFLNKLTLTKSALPKLTKLKVKILNKKQK